MPFTDKDKGDASLAAKSAFTFLMNFKNPNIVVDITDAFPHLVDLNKIQDPHLREALKAVVDGLDEDQRKTQEGVRSLPEGVCFVPGGPGAGKTSWALKFTTLAQAGAKRCPVLYLVDINKSADDAADKMQAMCLKLSINRSVIRVRGWPLVASELVEGEERASLPKVLRNADFAEGFLWLLETSTPRDLDKPGQLAGPFSGPSMPFSPCPAS